MRGCRRIEIVGRQNWQSVEAQTHAAIGAWGGSTRGSIEDVPCLNRLMSNMLP